MNLWVEGMILKVRTTADKGWLATTGRYITSLGMVLVAIYAGAAIHRAVSSHSALREFDKAQLLVRPELQKAPVSLPANQEIDFSLWSKARLAAYHAGQETKNGSASCGVAIFERLKIRGARI